MKQQRTWPVLVAAGLGVFVLLWLGFWQVQRLAWKEGLIAAYDKALAAPPVPLRAVTEAAEQGQPIDGMKVKLQGRYLNGPPLQLLSTTEGGPAYELLQGFTTSEGQTLLLVRGKLPFGQTPQSLPEGEVTLTGHVERHAGKRGFFDVDNEPDKNQWYWWQLPAMQQKAGVAPLGFVLRLAAQVPGTEGLLVEAPKANLRNNHLGYAITWFGLAGALIVITTIFLWRRRKAT